MVAVIIPYYKIDFFEETLQYLANQTNLNFNVYIGDDASSDDPLPLIEKFSPHLNIQYTRFEKNVGNASLVNQWARCIELSEGEDWLTILGDDDYYEENVIDNFYKSYSIFHNKTNLVRIASRIIVNETNFKSEAFEHPLWENKYDSLIRKLKGESRSSLSEYFFLKETYLKNHFYNFPLGWHSDDLAWLKFSGLKPIYTINNSVITIRNSLINISGRRDNLNLKTKAEIEFYSIIYNDFLQEFSKDQKILVLRKYENVLRKAGLLSNKKILIFLLNYIQTSSFYSLRMYIKRIFIYKIGSKHV